MYLFIQNEQIEMRLVSCRLKNNGHGCIVKDIIEDAIECFYRENANTVVMLSHNSFVEIIENVSNSMLYDRNKLIISDTPHSCHLDIYREFVRIESFETVQHDPQIMNNAVIVGDKMVDDSFLSKCTELHIFVLDISKDNTWIHPDIYANTFEMFSVSDKMWFPSINSYGYRIIYKRSDKIDVSENNVDFQYMNLLKRIIDKSLLLPRKNRTDIDTYSIFGEHIRIDISETIPALTTKRIPLKGCVEELLWFIRGDTDACNLKTPIWKDNSRRSELDKRGLHHLSEGDCGANYSFQWRFNGQEYKSCDDSYVYFTKGDQLHNVIDSIKKDPNSRRHFMSAWNPMDIDKTVLPPCHVSAQFYVDHNKGLSCHMYQRSCDAFLGLPWNILSYSILTHLIAKLTNLYPKELIISIGDAHIYTNHIEQVKEQLTRQPLVGPHLVINNDVINKPLHMLKVQDFEFVGYMPHSSLYGKMAV